MELIKIAIGWLLGFIYELVNNYGVALILFTLVIKLILLPLGLKQQKSMTKMQQIQPKITKLQEKYKNDQQLLSQETMKLYKEYGVSPMGGCLPLLIQLPVLFALYRVLYRPLTYMFGLADEAVAEMAAQLFWNDATQSGLDLANTMAQIKIAEASEMINFNFLGLNLAENPSFSVVASLAIPVLAGVTTYLTSKLTQWMNNGTKKTEEEEKKPQRILNPEQKTAPSAGNAESMTKSMTVVMPIFTLWITYTLPMALGVYWIASNIFSLGQTVLLNGYYSKKLTKEIEDADAVKIEAKSSKHNKKRRNK